MAKIRGRNINPMIYEKTRDGEFLYDVYSRLIKERILFLSEEIDSEVGTTVAASLLLLDSQNSSKDICLYINSPGGSVHDGLFTIYDTMNFIKSPVQTVCIGEGMSAAAVILAAGSPGKRLAFSNSHIMIHEVSTSLDGPGSTIEREAKQAKIINNKLIEILARHTKQKISKVRADCEKETYMNAEQAKKYGLIDKIVEPSKKIPDLIKNK